MKAPAAIHPYNGERGTQNQNRTTRRSYGTGRVPLMPDLAPNTTEPSCAWADAWEGYELHLEIQGHSKSTVSSRKSNVLAMARYFTAQGAEPADVTKVQLAKYLAAQCQGRAGCGAQSVYKDLRQFWQWTADDLEIPDPFAKVTRPSGQARPVEVVAWDDVGKLLAACAGKTDAETARNRAILWLFLETGLRRFELAALRLSDVDRSARRVLVRDGKGHKPRTACYGVSTAEALRRHLRYRGRDDGPLFPTFLGGSITPSGVSQLVKRVSRAAGVTVRPHMFRHMTTIEEAETTPAPERHWWPSDYERAARMLRQRPDGQSASDSLNGLKPYRR